MSRLSIFNSGFLFSNSSSNSVGNLYSSLSELSNIRSGTYKKVLKAYYAKQAGDSSGKKSGSSKTKATDDNLVDTATKALDKVQTDAKSLGSSADALITKGSKSLFNKIDITTKNEDGTETTTKGYDMNAIYNGVKKFADSYNSFISSADSSNSSKIQKQASNMVNMTKNYQKTLESVGVSIGANNKLSVDESKLKAADVNTLKTLFNGNGSYAYNVSTRASMSKMSAESEANKTKTYTNTGSYNNYSIGNLMDSIF